MTNKPVKATVIFTIKALGIDSTWVKTILNHKLDKTYFLKLSLLPVSSQAWLANQYYRLHSHLISPNKLSINAEGR
ncbi:MAG: hypothetical protein J6571_00270 [Snodgrassella sp.]|uniref:hypothetical protein n=1 Tax=Snodgrassella sp. TaxID=2815304 RepID=UPI002588AD6B|nr:hypothetical protein [Snodgrassella sp.]MCO6521613.1 hypothetical protein [Snodgrassella sp.]MCO6525888.1 hypothetical protein [Snodgrassella sp.]